MKSSESLESIDELALNSLSYILLNSLAVKFIETPPPMPAPREANINFLLNISPRVSPIAAPLRELMVREFKNSSNASLL